jgi:hypothetical protein
MPVLIFDEPSVLNAIEQRVVDNLHEPDQSNHEPGRNQIQQQYQ